MARGTRAGQWSTPVARVAFVVAVVGGIVMVAVPLARSALSGARAGDELVELASPVLSDDGLTVLRADLDTLTATGTALSTVGIPYLAERVGQTPDEFMAALVRDDPELAAAIADLPAVGELGERVVGNLERRQSEFESAASLPGLGLSLEQGAWCILVAGIALVGIGVAGLRRASRGLVVAATVFGVLLVTGPLALRYPEKTSDTDAILDSLRPFSVAKVEQREDGLATVQTVLAGMDATILPAVAAATGSTPAEVAAELGDVDPALTPAAFDDADTVVGRFASLVEFSRTIQPLLVEATNLPTRSFVWLTVGPGLALLATGAAALVTGARQRDGLVAHPTGSPPGTGPLQPRPHSDSLQP
jgi:hypothetical protein